MSEVDNIERTVQQLSESQLAGFRRWFLAYDADARDQQMEADAAAGKLDALAEEAISEYHAGEASEF